MTTRKLLKLIALIALLMGWHLTSRKMDRLYHRSNFHKHQAQLYEAEPDRKKKVFINPEGARVVWEVIEEPGQDVVPSSAIDWAKVEEYDAATMRTHYDRLSKKYAYYAWRPWLMMPEEPDPISTESSSPSSLGSRTP